MNVADLEQQNKDLREQIQMIENVNKELKA